MMKIIMSCSPTDWWVYLWAYWLVAGSWQSVFRQTAKMNAEERRQEVEDLAGPGRIFTVVTAQAQHRTRRKTNQPINQPTNQSINTTGDIWSLWKLRLARKWGWSKDPWKEDLRWVCICTAIKRVLEKPVVVQKVVQTFLSKLSSGTMQWFYEALTVQYFTVFVLYCNASTCTGLAVLQQWVKVAALEPAHFLLCRLPPDLVLTSDLRNDLWNNNNQSHP